MANKPKPRKTKMSRGERQAFVNDLVTRIVASTYPAPRQVQP